MRLEPVANGSKIALVSDEHKRSSSLLPLSEGFLLLKKQK